MAFLDNLGITCMRDQHRDDFYILRCPVIVTGTFFWRISRNASERSEFEYLTHPCDRVTSGAACLDKRADRLNELDAISPRPRIEKSRPARRSRGALASSDSAMLGRI